MVMVCNTHNDALAVFSLQKLIADIDMSKLVVDIACIIASLLPIDQPFQHTTKIYAVAYGINDSAIFTDWFRIHLSSVLSRVLVSNAIETGII